MGNCSEKLCPLYPRVLQLKYFTYIEHKKYKVLFVSSAILNLLTSCHSYTSNS